MNTDDSRPATGRDADGDDGRHAEEYEARLAKIIELAGRVRHEINNPLTGLLGQTQLLLRENLSETARRRVQTIEQLAARIRDAAAQLREAQLRESASAPDPQRGRT